MMPKTYKISRTEAEGIATMRKRTKTNEPKNGQR